jgi:hypothetical protein
MSNILTPYTSVANIIAGSLITSASVNTQKSNVDTYFTTNVPTTPVVSVSTSSSITTNNQYIFCANTSNITITLPAIPASGKNIWLKFVKTASNNNTITIVGNGSQTISSSANYVLYTKDSFIDLVGVVGTNDWVITSQYVETKTLRFRVWKETTTQTISANNFGTATPLIFNSINQNYYNDRADVNLTTGLFTCSVPGKWEFTGGVYWQTGSNQVECYLMNGTGTGGTNFGSGTNNNGNIDAKIILPAVQVKLAVGDIMSLKVVSQGSNRVVNTGQSDTWFAGKWLSF